jgi:hypothetical protein
MTSGDVRSPTALASARSCGIVGGAIVLIRSQLRRFRYSLFVAIS